MGSSGRGAAIQRRDWGREGVQWPRSAVAPVSARKARSARCVPHSIALVSDATVDGSTIYDDNLEQESVHS